MIFTVIYVNKIEFYQCLSFWEIMNKHKVSLGNIPKKILGLARWEFMGDQMINENGHATYGLVVRDRSVKIYSILNVWYGQYGCWEKEICKG